MPETYAVVYGGPSSEHDISVLTGLQALRILREIAAGGEVHSIYWSKRGDFYAVAPPDERTRSNVGRRVDGSAIARISVTTVAQSRY